MTSAAVRRAGILLAVALCITLVVAQPQCHPRKFRQDCGVVGDTQDSCIAKGCCWHPDPSGIPWCFKSNGVVQGYALDSIQQLPNGYTATLVLQDGAAAYGDDISPLKMDATFDSASRLRVKIYDPNHPRYEIPKDVLPVPDPQPGVTPDYIFSWSKSPFGFAVIRKADREVIFNSTTDGSFNGLIFQNQYIEFTTTVAKNPNIYGLGEHIRDLKLDYDGRYYTMWTRDAPNPPHQNEYGAHPFHLEMRNGKAHGVFFRNSNGQEMQLYNGQLIYRTIGGIIDLHFFIGPTPDAVMKQYQEVIGTPYLPPTWSLGFHHCRYGYKNLGEVKATVAGYKNANIPLEAIWTDIDYMDGFRDFTFDKVNFPLQDVQAFVRDVHQNGQKYVLILDPAIKVDPGYGTYDRGLAANVYINNRNGQPFIGKVWPDYTTFPSFFNPSTHAWWQDEIKRFLDWVPVDGLWIDMNEPASFCNGECRPGEPSPVVPPATTRHGYRFDPNNPPYAINNAGARRPLNTNTLDVDTVHLPGLLEYDVHNLYGHTESIATRAALEKLTGKRAFVLSRSTFPGTGHHAGHWLGDNFSTWESLRYAISGALHLNLFGIPFTGSDICGFIGTTTEELCGRWIQAGAFHSFSRNHNTIGAPDQALYLWPKVAEISRTVLNLRYSLISYYVTLHYEAHKYGGTVVRPLFFEFPDDPKTYPIDQQFLVGPGLLVSPVNGQGHTSVNAYLPNTPWFDAYDYTRINGTGAHQNLAAPFEHIPVHHRGGVIFTKQAPKMTVEETLRQPFTLLVALDYKLQAKGSLYLDDGETLDTEKSTYVNYMAASRALKAIVQRDNHPAAASLVLERVVFLGIGISPVSVYISDMEIPPNQWSVDKGNLDIRLQWPMNKPFTITYN